MFLPFGDTPQPPRGWFPWVNWLLIAVNVAVFVFYTLPLSFAAPDPNDPSLRSLIDRINELPVAARAMPTAWDVFIERWGYVPSRPSVATLFTAMFMHANFAHVAGNMLFLWIYGDNVEHRIGRIPYLLTYLGTGVIATLAFASFAPHENTPLVGASGAISGSLGAYFVMFPRNRIKMLVGLPPFLIDVWMVPAPIVLGMYVLIDNLLPFLATSGGSVAYGAHLGGFVGGVVVAFLAERFLSRTPSRSDDPNVRAESYLAEAERLASAGQFSAAYRRFVSALELTDDPRIAAAARRGIHQIRLDPRMARRYD